METADSAVLQVPLSAGTRGNVLRPKEGPSEGRTGSFYNMACPLWEVRAFPALQGWDPEPPGWDHPSEGGTTGGYCSWQPSMGMSLL